MTLTRRQGLPSSLADATAVGRDAEVQEMDQGDERLWKVGQLAQLTGITVRALHHYDHLGLVPPSLRTASGHRLYEEPDVDRLYRVVALRDLGLSLEAIGTVLTGAGPLEAVLQQHLDQVDRQLAALRALRSRLAATLATAKTMATPTTDDLLDLIGKVTTVDETIKNYFTDEQLAALSERREHLGEQAIADAQTEWPQLIARVGAEMDAGTDPADPAVQDLARRWMQLLHSFHGGDEGLRDSLYRMQADNSDQIRQEHGGPTPEMMDYIKRANASAA